MSVIATLRRALGRDTRGEERQASFGSWSEYLGWVASGYGGGTLEQALRNAASWACIDVLTDGIARTPFDAVRYQGDVRVPVTPTPAILAKPSGIVRSDVWLTQLATSLVTDGNVFGKIVQFSDRNVTRPLQVELIDPCIVGQRELIDGIPHVSIQGAAPEQLWPHGPIWHSPGRLVLAGSPFGLSPIKYAAKTLGTTLAVEDFSNKYFTDGGHPTVAIYADQALNEKQAQAIKDSYRRATHGNSREPAVFGSGLKLDTLQSDPNQTQFIDLWRFEVEQACRFWRVPPSMVYAATSGQSVTYANVTQADLNYLKHSLDGYFVRIENALTDLLPAPQKVKANRNAILRADAEARNKVYDTRLKNKTTTINAVRALEDEPPFDDPIYDQPGIPGGAIAPAPTGEPAQ